MAVQPTREDKMRDAFLVIGSQYFAHARYSAQIYYLPVSATLFHHSLEMLLKGYLAKHLTSAELKKIGHDLRGLWQCFKDLTGDAGLSALDSTITELDKVELLRYPDAIVDHGYVLHMGLGKAPTALAFPGMEKLPNYYVDVYDIDVIAEKVFAACGVSPVPYFKGAPNEFLLALPTALRGSM